MKRPLAVGLLSLSLFQFSAQNAVAIGSYRNAPTLSNSANREMEAAVGWAAIAAGVAVVGAVVATVEAAYNIGTIVGHAAHDMFGKNQELAANFERASYVADDFSQFDHPGQI